MGSQAVYVTAEGLKKLEEELEHLRTVKRVEVAQRLHEAMEGGELIENAEYEAAKNEQAFVEGRILELEHMLAQAKIIEPGQSTETVRIGNTVVVSEFGGTAGDLHDCRCRRGQSQAGPDLQRIPAGAGTSRPPGRR